MNSWIKAGFLAIALLPSTLTVAADTNLYSDTRTGGSAVSLLINQVGYDPAAAKTVVVQVTDLTNQPPLKFQIVNDSDEVLFQGKLVSRGGIHEGTTNDWGARYWTGDFTAVHQPGTYRVRIPLDSPGRTYGNGRHVKRSELTSFWFQIGKYRLFHQTAFAAARFFYFQRCGFAIPGVHEACHLDDAQLPDSLGGGHIDATGGWHDAGDYNKYIHGYTCHSVYALTTLARDGSPFLSDQERRQVLDEAQWGADFVLKMWQPGKGIMYYTVTSGYDYWGAPDRETDDIPGNGDDRLIRGEGPQPMAAAALAALCHVSGQIKYHAAAEDLWRGAVAAKPEARVKIGSPVEEFDAGLLLADIELERLTGEHAYVDDAAMRVEAILKQQGANGLWSPNMVAYGLAPAALTQFAETHPASPLAERIGGALRAWVKGNCQAPLNPFQITPWKQDELLYQSTGKYWGQGQNSLYLSQAWALYRAGNLLKEPAAFALADRQMDWVLGVNPYNVCMMEGQGTFNFPSYHHRYTGDKEHWPGIPGQERGAIPGAIPNGLRRAQMGVDRPYTEFVLHGYERPDWRSLEPWLPHNAFYLLAVTAQARANRPLTEPESPR